MLTVYRKENKLDADKVYDVLVNGCLMGKLKNGEKLTIDMKDKETLNFTLSDELSFKLQVVSDKHKSAEIPFAYDEHQIVEFECISDYTEGSLGRFIDKSMNKKGIKLEKTKDFFLY